MNSDETTQNDPFSPEQELGILKIRVSLKGRPIRSYAFTKDVVTVGRDPEADVFLDNPGISREHLRIEKTPEGYCAEDLGSANGTYLNDELVQRRLLSHEDVLCIGKFSLWISLEEDRRNSAPEGVASTTTHQGTTVLSMADLQALMAKIKETEPVAAVEAPPVSRPHASSKGAWIAGLIAVFTLGLILGMALLRVLTR